MEAFKKAVAKAESTHGLVPASEPHPKLDAWLGFLRLTHLGMGKNEKPEDHRFKSMCGFDRPPFQVANVGSQEKPKSNFGPPPSMRDSGNCLGSL